MAHWRLGFPNPECLRTVKSWWKKRENSPGASLYKEQKRNTKESQKFMSLPEKTKICLNIYNVLPQYNLVEQILSYMRKGKDGL